MSSNFSNKNRNHFIERLRNDTFDLLVIGGGITGCGIALDAALRGMKVALVEKNDFASGTSSRSTKLIHGGLRYLKQLEFKLVRDVGSERAVVHKNARHIVIPEKMLLPIFSDGSLGKQSSSLGLLVYDILAGVKKDERRKMLNKHETLKAEPLLSDKNLIGGGLYFEYRTDDSRLTIEIAKSAYTNGALLLNYTKASSFIYDSGKIKGIKAQDIITGNTYDIKAKTVVNACGPWVDLLRKEDNSLKGKRLQLTKGVHIVFPFEKLPLKQAAYFDVGDGRMIFAIPRNGITYVGTTDTVYNQDIDKPRCTQDDTKYLVNAVNRIYPKVGITENDIVSSWAGLRPLIFEEGKSASELSRKDEIMVSSSGLISIAGGKLTGYRLMASKVVSLVGKKLGRNFGTCKTKQFKLSGGEFRSDEQFEEEKKQLISVAVQSGISSDKAIEWFYRYGTNCHKIIDIYHNLKDTSSSPEEFAEFTYCLENEMILHPSDYLIRRTGKIFFDINLSEKNIDSLTQHLTNTLNLKKELSIRLQREVHDEYYHAKHFS